MNKFKFFLCFYFFCSIISAQRKNIITYEAFSNSIDIEKIVKDKIKEKEIITRLNETFNSDDKQECILIIENGKSFFFKVEKMGLNKKSIVDILVGNGLYYSNSTDLYVLEEKTTFDKFFLIKHDKINWQLINEEKQIGAYVCKKAIAKKTVVNDQGVFESDIIAWYAPEIPLNFGPKNFNGLPGLIIELMDRQIVFKVSKIELNSNNKKYNIKEPKKGNVVTYEEYETALKNLFYNYKN